jgi:hypothetical protein
VKAKPAGLIAASAAAALAAAIAMPALTTAQAPSPTSITFQENRPQIAMDDLAPKSKSGNLVSLGDRIVTWGGLFDTSRKQLGTIGTSCTAAGPTKPILSATLLCTVSYQVADGQIVASGFFKLNGTGVLPIVGGSGAYAGARGTVTSGKPAKGFEDADVITLAG